MLEHVEQALNNGPKKIAGITFSDRLLRYVLFEKRNGTYTLGSWGEITIPFDVMQQGKVTLPIEFTDIIKTLNNVIPPDTTICIKKDTDEHKSQSLKLAGYNTIKQIPLPDALASLYLVVGIDSTRVCLFVTDETLHVFLYEHMHFHKVASVDMSEKEGVVSVITDVLKKCENKQALYTGQGKEYIQYLTESGIEVVRAEIFQNIFDKTRYIPEMPQEESYRYTVPTALVLFALHFQIQKKTDPSTLQKKPKEAIDSAYGGLKPLTKLKEDKRRNSEKK